MSKHLKLTKPSFGFRQRQPGLAKLLSLSLLLVFFILGSCTSSRMFFWTSNKSAKPLPHYGSLMSRRLLWTTDKNITSGNQTKQMCTQPGLSEFPRDVFTQQQRQYGAVLLHAFAAVYMFVALAFVCDDYFVSALDKICERMNVSEDVAGATFMAAGSSGPELFTSLIGVFITKGDVGVGTIVGSAVFNILIIIALCCLFAGQVVHLTAWPLLRDSGFYVLAIAALIWAIYDGEVSWYESVLMLLLYASYIVVMRFNPMILKKIDDFKAKKPRISRLDSSSSTYLMVDCNDKNNGTFDYQYDSDLGMGVVSKKRLTWRDIGMMTMLTDRFAPSSRLRAACLIVIWDHKRSGASKDVRGNDKAENSLVSVGQMVAAELDDVTLVAVEGSPFVYPHGSFPRLLWWLMALPLVAILYITVPDCRKPRWQAWYLLTFFMSVFWIMVFSYILVWMVSIIGFTLGIPDVIMGITFLAAGTSIPDAIASLLVSKQGMGDMALSNSIGSNVFDILVGLALPWFLQSAVVKPGSKITINSRGLIYSVWVLFASVFLTVLAIHCNRWRLTRPLGVLFVLVYVIVVAISALVEFNVFTFVNYPTCPYNG